MASLRQQKTKAYDSLAGRLKRGKSIRAAIRDMRSQGYRFSDRYIHNAAREIMARRDVPNARVSYVRDGRRVSYEIPRRRARVRRVSGDGLPMFRKPSDWRWTAAFIYTGVVDVLCEDAGYDNDINPILDSTSVMVSFGSETSLSNLAVYDRLNGIANDILDSIRGNYGCENPSVSIPYDIEGYYA